MNTVLKMFGGLLMFVGLLMMAGSAGDCDGACMEQANTIGEMITYALAGLTMMLSGVYMVYLGGGLNED